MADLFNTQEIHPSEIKGCVGCDFIQGLSKKGGICVLCQALEGKKEEEKKPALYEKFVNYRGPGLPITCPRHLYLEETYGGCLPDAWKRSLLFTAPKTRALCNENEGCSKVDGDWLGAPFKCMAACNILFSLQDEAIAIASGIIPTLRGGCPNGQVFRLLAEQANK